MRALRIGMGTPENPFRYCCLGVLCELAVKAGAIAPATFDSASSQARYENNPSYLPDQVMQWAGLDDSNPLVGERSLSYANDKDKVSFDGIADLIEQHLIPKEESVAK